jgi:hypothetical protein
MDRSLPRGMVDTHVHTAPDVLPRSQTDHSVSVDAAQAGYRALVLKNHHSETASRAAVITDFVGEVEVLGGIVLNIQATGGINPLAAESALRMGARCVWLPTISAANQIRALNEAEEKDGGAAFVDALGRVEGDGVSILSADGSITPETGKVLDLVASYQATLATGHISPAEMMAVVPEAKRRGVRNVIITHPEMQTISPTFEQQTELAALGGVWFERVYALYTPMFGYDLDDLAEIVRTLGHETTIMASDLGQDGNPPTVEGMRDFVAAMLERGFSKDQVEQMTCSNPRAALGLAER